MERIYLTKKEKEVLRYINTHETHYQLVNNDLLWPEMISLHKKGLTITSHNEKRVHDIKLSTRGRTYLFCNPKLKNPFNYKLWTFIVTIILTITTIIGLFIRCTSL